MSERNAKPTGEAARTASGGLPPRISQERSTPDLRGRCEQLAARFAELQYDLGGILYEMSIRDHIRIEVLLKHAGALQDVDAELREVERILHLDDTGNAGSCASCGVPHSGGAVYCWQCGRPLLAHVSSSAISTT